MYVRRGFGQVSTPVTGPAVSSVLRPPSCFSLVNKLMTGNSDTSVCLGPASQITWGMAVGLGLIGWFLFRKGGR